MSLMNSNKIKDTRLKAILLILKATGLYNYNRYETKIWNTIYGCYSAFVYFCCITNGVLMFSYLFTSIDTLEELSDCLTLCISQIVFASKMYPFIFQDEKVRKIIQGLKNHFYTHGNQHSIRQLPIIQSSIYKCNVFVCVFLCMIIGTGFLMLMTPVAKEITKDVNCTERYLPFPMWYPFDISETRYFAIAMTQQCIFGFIEGASEVAVPLLFYLVLIVHTTVQFEILSTSIATAKESVRDRLSEKHYNIDRYDNKRSSNLIDLSSHLFSQEDLDAEMYRYLRECVHYHQSLLQYVKELNSMVTPMFFLEFSTTAITFCLIGYQLMATSGNIVQLMKIAMHLVCMLSMVGFVCWFGSNLMHHSQEVCRAAYECEWYEQSTGVKMLIQMLIMRAQKPARLTAGYFGTISISLFGKLTQTSYSYLAVLRQMKE